MRYSERTMSKKTKQLKPVGEFIRKKRENLGLSQKSLGLLFKPPVTTQFISNIERGVTPLPPHHISVLARCLQISEMELKFLLEQEYAMKLSGRLGLTDADLERSFELGSDRPGADFVWIQKLYDAYRIADSETRKEFASVCQSLLKLPREASRSSESR